MFVSNICSQMRPGRWLAGWAILTAAELAIAQPTLNTAFEARWFRNVRQITNAGMGLTKAGEAYFSPDARRICFQAVPAGGEEYQIYVMNLDGGGLRRLSSGAGATTCAYFHPDGKRVLFASNHLDPRPATPPPGASSQPARGGRYAWPFFPGMDLFECDLETGTLKQLTQSEGYDAEGSYSPDGRFIVFSSFRDGDQEIYICDSDGGNPRRVTHAKGYDGGPFFSPDGRRIVYRSDRQMDDNLQIFVADVSGLLEGTATQVNETSLTDNKSLHWCPYWHPSGNWLIYTLGRHYEDRRPTYDLVLLSADGRESHPWTDDPAFDGLPVFSPDGSKLMWTSRRGGLESPHVFLADVVGLSRSGAIRPASENQAP